MHHLTDRRAHTTAFVTPVVEHWVEREIAQWVIQRIQAGRHTHLGTHTTTAPCPVSLGLEQLAGTYRSTS